MDGVFTDCRDVSQKIFSGKILRQGKPNKKIKIITMDERRSSRRRSLPDGREPHARPAINRRTSPEGGESGGTISRAKISGTAPVSPVGPDAPKEPEAKRKRLGHAARGAAKIHADGASGPLAAPVSPVGPDAPKEPEPKRKRLGHAARVAAKIHAGGASGHLGGASGHLGGASGYLGRGPWNAKGGASGHLGASSGHLGARFGHRGAASGPRGFGPWNIKGLSSGFDGGRPAGSADNGSRMGTTENGDVFFTDGPVSSKNPLQKARRGISEERFWTG